MGTECCQVIFCNVQNVEQERSIVPTRFSKELITRMPQLYLDIFFSIPLERTHLQILENNPYVEFCISSVLRHR